VFRWEERHDTFEQVAPLRDEAGLARYAAFIQQLVGEGEADAGAIRRRALAFYNSGARTA